MATATQSGSPWRAAFEQVRQVSNGRKDEDGVRGSINWLRAQMHARGANPNVVRNIIYRDKGRLEDKQALFDIMNSLWQEETGQPLTAPDLELLLAPASSADQEVLQMLGKQNRLAFQAFVGDVQSGRRPSLLISGRPGSGKTLLTDYLERAVLDHSGPEDRTLVRVEFGSDLERSLLHTAARLNLPADSLAARLAKVGSGGPYAVQADNQADVGRTLVDAARRVPGELVCLVHLSQSLLQQVTLGGAPLRIPTPSVPRVDGATWLWRSLLGPLLDLPRATVVVTFGDEALAPPSNKPVFEHRLNLTPPTPSEARKFIRARLPHLPSQEQDAIVRTAGRSYETIRTLTLLSEVRAPLPEGHESHDPNERLVDLMRFGGDERLRDFLAALATVRLPQHPTFTLADLNAVRDTPHDQLNDVERAFLDPSPGSEGAYRCFSRRLAEDLRAYLLEHEPDRARALHAKAAAALEADAYAAPDQGTADRYLHHLFDARDFPGLMRWMANGTLPHTLISRAWSAAESETHDEAMLDAFAEHVVQHYVTLGSYRHPDAERAFARLRNAPDATRRAWAEVTQAEGAVLRGAFEEATERLNAAPDVDDPRLQAEAALLRASEARWRGNLEEAVRHVEEGARPQVERLDLNHAQNALTRSKLAVWAGLIQKDRGLAERALEEFTSVHAANPLVRARLAFQQADVLMLLGRLPAALKQFDLAVHLAERSGALASERTRYLARRASLNVRMGALAAAEDDFDAADRLLATVDRPHRVPEVWKARVNDERILLLLARGRFDDALATAADVVERYRQHGEEHGIDATFRIDRATLRLGLAYVARSFGRPWAAPFPSPASSEPRAADHQHGVGILKTLAATREARLAGHEGLEPLTRRILMILALVDQPGDAVQAAERLVAAGGPAFAQAEAFARLADARLRLGDTAGASDAMRSAWPALHDATSGVHDPGASTHLHRVALTLATHQGDADAAFDALDSLAAGGLPTSFVRETLWAWGTALERHGRDDWWTHPRMPAGLAGAADTPSLRPSDRLAVRHDRRGLPAPQAPTPKEEAK